MLTYLIVGLGGAIGSMARYAISVAAGAAWGEAFPWGTILINATGSFLIGFVGTLTLPEGPLPASQDIRLFALVGLCGGYTTFSSFSLQTVSLMRGGQWLGALANVLLSVFVCIAAAGAGHGLAQQAGRLGHRQASSAQTILAVLDRAETARPVLAASGLLAARLGGARIEVLSLRHDPDGGFMRTEDVMTDAQRRASERRAALHRGALRSVFDRWRQDTAQPETAWRTATEPAKAAIAAEGGRHALIVIGRAPQSSGEAKEAIQAALLGRQSPVLLVPEAIPQQVGRHVAVAWKPGQAAERAVQAALPILLKADQVTILIATGSGEPGAAGVALQPGALLQRLRAGGIDAAVDQFDQLDRPAGAALLDAARRHGADLMVMGAFTHGRLTEALFGGATREILADADVPVLMQG